MKTPLRSILLPPTLLLLLVAFPLFIRKTYALTSCSPSSPTAVVSFSQGQASDGTPIDSAYSDPNTLLTPTTSESFLALGIGGSITLSFSVPLANYPAAGLPQIRRQSSADPCSSNPVQARLFGSSDGILFSEIGVTCEGGAFSLDQFPWISYLRIVDTSDPQSPALIGKRSLGFTINSISGPGCLKYAHCIQPSVIDPVLASSSAQETLSLGSLGDDFILDDTGSFEEYGNGSARFIGFLSRRSKPDAIYEAVLSFTGRVTAPPGSSPVLLLRSSAYSSQGGPIDPSSWYYYKTVRGSVRQVSPTSAEYYQITGTTSALQVGSGADGRSASRGAATTFTLQEPLSDIPAELAFIIAECPNATPTPISTPSPTPTVEPKPTDTIDDSSASCLYSDLTDVLAALDQALLTRSEIVFRVSRALIRVSASRSNLLFQTRSRTQTRSLIAAAWATVWQHPWSVLRCPNNAGCSSLSLRTNQDAIRRSISALDRHVAATISRVQKRVKTRDSRTLFKKLRSKHSSLQGDFKRMLESLPLESFSCTTS